MSSPDADGDAGCHCTPTANQIVVGVLDRLDHAVQSDAGRHEAVGHALDGLAMLAVDDDFPFAVDLRTSSVPGVTLMACRNPGSGGWRCCSASGISRDRSL